MTAEPAENGAAGTGKETGISRRLASAWGPDRRAARSQPRLPVADPDQDWIVRRFSMRDATMIDASNSA